VNELLIVRLKDQIDLVVVVIGMSLPMKPSRNDDKSSEKSTAKYDAKTERGDHGATKQNANARKRESDGKSDSRHSRNELYRRIPTEGTGRFRPTAHYNHPPIGGNLMNSSSNNWIIPRQTSLST